MTTLAQLHDHLRMLKVEEALLLEECDWEGLNLVRMALDDTHDQINTVEKE